MYLAVNHFNSKAKLYDKAKAYDTKIPGEINFKENNYETINRF